MFTFCNRTVYMYRAVTIQTTLEYKCKQHLQNILPSNKVTWRPVYEGFTNTGSNPEPGRCGQTDDKKWQCSKEVMAEHKYCEPHINRNCHRSRKPVENQTRKTAKETPAAGTLASPSSPRSSKKAKATYELMRGSDSCWTDRLNRLVYTETEFWSYIYQNYSRAMDSIISSIFVAPLITY